LFQTRSEDKKGGVVLENREIELSDHYLISKLSLSDVIYLRKPSCHLQNNISTYCYMWDNKPSAKSTLLTYKISSFCHFQPLLEPGSLILCQYTKSRRDLSWWSIHPLQPCTYASSWLKSDHLIHCLFLLANSQLGLAPSAQEWVMIFSIILIVMQYSLSTSSDIHTPPENTYSSFLDNNRSHASSVLSSHRSGLLSHLCLWNDTYVSISELNILA